LERGELGVVGFLEGIKRRRLARRGFGKSPINPLIEGIKGGKMHTRGVWFGTKRIEQNVKFCLSLYGKGRVVWW